MSVIMDNVKEMMGRSSESVKIVSMTITCIYIYYFTNKIFTNLIFMANT